MKKLSILILCLTLCNCHAFQQNKRYEERYAKRQEERRQEEIVKTEKIEKLRTTDPVNYRRIKTHKIAVGMSKEHLVLSWGKPGRKNKTCTQNGCLVQYIYSTAYVYLWNGKIRSWQTKSNRR